MVLAERMRALGDQAKAKRKIEDTPKEKDDSAAKRAITHEWENWATLHPDDRASPDAAKYFFAHLQKKKPALLEFVSEDKWQAVRNWLLQEFYIRD
jgi:hypothetical protein